MRKDLLPQIVESWDEVFDAATEIATEHPDLIGAGEHTVENGSIYETDENTGRILSVGYTPDGNPTDITVLFATGPQRSLAADTEVWSRRSVQVDPDKVTLSYPHDALDDEPTVLVTRTDDGGAEFGPHIGPKRQSQVLGYLGIARAAIEDLADRS